MRIMTVIFHRFNYFSYKHIIIRNFLIKPKCILHVMSFIISLNICIEQSQYNAQKAGITSAIVIAVLLPIGICGFCLLLQLRNKAADVREKKEGGGGGYNTYNQGPM